MQGTHIMTDIETLGKKDGATIFQIAAATFDIKTGKIRDCINLKLDIEKADLVVDGNTLKWWLDTDKELLTQLLKKGNLTEIEMFTKFSNWVSKYENPKLWGNGILFDNLKLKLKMESLGIEYPINYKNDRDVRTILALASDVSGVTENSIKSLAEKRGEKSHDALSDVKRQIRLVSCCYDLIKNPL